MIPIKEDTDSGKDFRAADRGLRIEDPYPLPEEDTTKDDKPNDGTDSENDNQHKNGNEHENDNQHKNGNEHENGHQGENGNGHENGNQHENGNEHVYNVAAAQQDALDSCLEETRRVKVLRVRFHDAASVFFNEYLTSAGGYACPDQQRILVATIKQLQADLGIDYNYAAMWTIRVFFTLPMFNNNYFGMIEAFERLMPVWTQLYENWQLSRILLDVLAVDVLESLQNRLPGAHLFLMIACISRVGFIRGDVFAAWFCALPGALRREDYLRAPNVFRTMFYLIIIARIVLAAFVG